MRRGLILFVAGLAVACGSALGPSPLYPSYFLTSVDGKQLPTPYAGSELLAGSLSFSDPERARSTGQATGLVRYTLSYRRPDGSLDQSTVELSYSITAGVLRIGLCPMGAFCLVSSELVGPIPGRNSELVLTNHMGSSSASVYRFFPSLPD